MGQLAQDPRGIRTFQYQYCYLGLFNIPPVSTWSYYNDSQASLPHTLLEMLLNIS
jgi:hypothetical protein